jgi:hypothetical protein
MQITLGQQWVKRNITVFPRKGKGKRRRNLFVKRGIPGTVIQKHVHEPTPARWADGGVRGPVFLLPTRSPTRALRPPVFSGDVPCPREALG